ncbi:MAG: hypothetical protein EBR82_80125 [Caulobacteraceae bacterium]|nr:hypothetical protein [Caulobacteraceae bacterium]
MKKLINAVKRQLGENWKEDLENVLRCSSGAAGGFSGFIYYSETTQFAKKYRKSIVELLEEQAEDLGYSGSIEMVRSFNCLKGFDPNEREVARSLYGRPTEEDTQILNALAWYALEEVARWWEFENE